MAKETPTTLPFDTVASLIATLEKEGTIIGKKHYATMAALDANAGMHTLSSFDHQFRQVKARAKELLAMAGDVSTASATPSSTSKAGKGGKAKASGSSKRSKCFCGSLLVWVRC